MSGLNARRIGRDDVTRSLLDKEDVKRRLSIVERRATSVIKGHGYDPTAAQVISSATVQDVGGPAATIRVPGVSAANDVGFVLAIVEGYSYAVGSGGPPPLVHWWLTDPVDGLVQQAMSVDPTTGSAPLGVFQNSGIVVIRASPGVHVYTLKYSFDFNSFDATVTDRRLALFAF